MKEFLYELIMSNLFSEIISFIIFLYAIRNDYEPYIANHNTMNWEGEKMKP